jgi:hypothetical protein
MSVEELSIKVYEEDTEGEIRIPVDPTAAIALLATLAHVVAGSVGISDAELLDLLSTLMKEEIV